MTPRLMVVDSERVIADTLAIILRSRGYDCTVAYTGVHALQIARQLRPDLILMEVVMPGMHGTEAGRIILDEQPECKIVFLVSSSSSEALLEELKQHGYTFGTLVMPAPPQDILKMVCELGFEPPITPP
ncbi:MAG TPA: response regulator [Candidatus Angelobacter sp.]